MHRGCDIAEGKVGLTVTRLINTLADAPGVVKCVYIMGENPMISRRIFTMLKRQ